MKYILIFFIFHVLVFSLLAQKHSLGLSLSAMHDINTYDETSDRDNSISLPLNILSEYGLEYMYAPKSNLFGFYASIHVISNGLRIKRKFEPTLDGNELKVTALRATSSEDGGLRLGIHYNKSKIFNYTLGLSTKWAQRIRPGGFGPKIYDNEIYHAISQFVFLSDRRIHNSLFLIVDFNLNFLNDKKNKFNLIFTANIGLQPIYQTSSTIENLLVNQTKEIILNNYGHYLAIGLAYRRISDGKFIDIFHHKYRNRVPN